MIRKLSMLLISVGLVMGLYAQKYPFPQNVDYPHAAACTKFNETQLTNLYKQWLNNYYEVDPNASSGMARIKFDESQYTVSEGIAYGMIIFVYMDNAELKTQEKFDKLWKYYEHFSNGNGVMNWKIQEFSGPTSNGYNGATDAELDVALTLLMAHEQWGSSGDVNYLAKAETLISKIYDHEVSSNGLIKVGDGWGSDGDYIRNPCYVTTAAVKLFADAQTKYGFSQTRDWDKVLTASYDFLDKAANDDTGLVPDWCDNDGNKINGRGYDYYYDACRMPWRTAWDYAWFGNSRAKKLTDDVGQWAKNLSYDNVVSGYTITGNSIGQWKSEAFTGGFACSYFLDPTLQSNLNTYYDKLDNTLGGTYYNATMQVMYLLFLSGNTPNFMDANTGPMAPRVKTATTSDDGTQVILSFSKELKTVPSSAAGDFTISVNGTDYTATAAELQSDNTVIVSFDAPAEVTAVDTYTITYSGSSIIGIDDLSLSAFNNYDVDNKVDGGFTLLFTAERGNQTELATYMFSYDDSNNDGGSTMTPNSDNDKALAMTLDGAGGTDSALVVEYNLLKADNEWGPFVGVGFEANEGVGTGDAKTVAPFGSEFANAAGISFYHKGDPMVVELVMTPAVEPTNLGVQYSYTMPEVNDEWTLVSIKFTDFGLPSWFTPGTSTPDFDFTKVNKVQFKIAGADKAAAQPGDFGLDQIGVYGVSVDLSSRIVDKYALQTAIETATAGLGNASAGSLPGQYPQSAMDDLELAIADAEAILETIGLTQEEYDAAADDMLAAFNAFKAQVIEDSTFTLMEDAEDGNHRNLIAGSWFTYDDGYSVIAPVGGGGTDFTMTAGGYDGSDNKMRVEFELKEGNAYPGVGVGTTITAEDVTDLSDASGVSFWHKGTATIFQVVISTVGNDQHFEYPIGESADWTEIKINWSATDAGDLMQPDWGASSEFVDWNPAIIESFQFKLDGAAGRTGELEIDDMKLRGIDIKVVRDFSALETLMTEATTLYTTAEVGTGNGQYPQDAYDTYEEAYLTSKELLDAEVAFQDEIDGTVEWLTDAIADFKASASSVSKDALVEAIEKAEAVIDAVVTGEGNGEYALADYETFNTAINAAKAVNADAAASADDIAAAVENLNAAVTAFEATVIEVDYSALNTKIDDADGILAAATIGTADGEYMQSVADKFEESIDAAKAVESKTNATEAEITQAVSELTDAIELFEASVNSSVVNLQPLADKITEATALLDKPEGTEPGQFPASAFDDLEAEIATAQGVHDDAASTSADVINATNDLDDAIKAFNATEIKAADKSALEAAIVTANGVKNGATVGDGPGEYPAAAMSDLEDAIADAQAVVDNANATAADVTTAITDLNNAVKAFEATVNGLSYASLETKIAEVQTLMDSKVYGTAPGEFPVSAKLDLSSAIADAQTFINDDMATKESDITAQIALLDAAVDKFNKTEIPAPDKDALATLIANAETAVSEAVAGDKPGNYPQSAITALSNALSTAKDVNDNAKANQADVDEAKTNLDAAVKAFTEAQVPQPDKSGLDAAITAAEEQLATAKADAAMYDAPKVSALEDIIAEAESMMEDASATQAEIDAKKAQVDKAAKAVADSKIEEVVDYSELETAIADAKDELNGATFGTKVGDYPLIAGDEFMDAIRTAEDALDFETQDEVDAAVKELEDAQLAFLFTKITVGLEDLASVGITYGPVPLTNALTINAKSDIATVEIFDVNGKVAVSEIVDAANAKVSIAKLAKGTYSVVITLKNGEAYATTVLK